MKPQNKTYDKQDSQGRGDTFMRIVWQYICCYTGTFIYLGSTLYCPWQSPMQLQQHFVA